jgi:hypothetical protein
MRSHALSKLAFVVALGAVVLLGCAGARAEGPLDNPDVPMGLVGVELGYLGPISKSDNVDRISGDGNNAHLTFMFPLSKRSTLLTDVAYEWKGEYRTASVATAGVRLRFYLGKPRSAR